MSAAGDVLALRPFVPAKDFDLAKRYYRALGGELTYDDDSIAIVALGSMSFILQNYYLQAFAENCMIQLLVRDVDAWWARTDPAAVAAAHGAAPPRAPAMQDWGMKVGFVFDPSGVLWHVAELPA